MNIKSLACITLFAFSSSIYGIDESIRAAIQSSNVESLQALLMPGAYVRLQDKKLYSSLAQQKTKDAFLKLQSSSFSDIKRGGASLFKALLAVLSAKEFYTLISTQTSYTDKDDQQGNATIAEYLRDKVAYNAKDNPKEAFLHAAHITSTHWGAFLCASVAGYFGCKSWGDFKAIMHKDQRSVNYIRALAVESLVARVPVFEQ